MLVVSCRRISRGTFIGMRGGISGLTSSRGVQAEMLSQDINANCLYKV